MAGSFEQPSRATPDRRRRAVIASAVVVTLVLLGFAAARSSESSPVDDARHLVRSDRNFATATETGVTFTKVSRHLESAAETCRSATRSTDLERQARCDGLFSGAAYARVSAVAVLRCTRPGVFEARASMRAYLDELAASEEAAPALPPIVRCR